MAMAKTGSVDDAVERALARGKGGDGGGDDGAVVDPEEIIRAEPEEAEVITIGGDDDDGDDDSKASGGAQRPSRRERRNERGWNHMEELLAQERERAAKLEGRLDQLTAFAVNQPRHQGPQTIPEDVELENLHKEMETRAIAWEAKFKNARPTHEEWEAEKRHAREIEIKKDDILARRRERMRGGPQGVDPRTVNRMVLEQQYADLLQHPDPRVAAEFQVEHMRRTTVERKPDNAQTLAESAEVVRRKYKIGGPERRPVTARRQQQYSGTPVGGGDDGGGGGPLSVKITPEIKEMARIVYGDQMPEKERLQKWVKNNGRRYLEKQRGGGSARSD